MATARKSGRKTQRAKPAAPPRPWELGAVETIAWLLALGMVAFRCLIQESAEYGWQLSFSLADLANAGEAAVFAAPGPVTTVWLTLGMLVVFGLWAVAWINGGCARPRRTHLGIPLMGLAVAVIVSTAAAANKRPAIMLGADLLATVLLGWTMVQLLRHRWQVRVTVAILLAVGCVAAIKGFYQVGVELPATRQMYYENRDKFIGRGDVAVDLDSLDEFEKRLNAASATGTFHHANAFGSLLLLLGVAGAGLAVGKLTSVRHPFGWLFAGVTALGVLAILGALFATGSIGARVGLCAAAGVFVVLLLGGRWLKAHLKAVGIVVAVGLVLAAAGVVLYGRANGRLPTTNLAIRWQYWSASSGMIAEHGWTGVGAGNFGDHYTRYMAAGAGEEVTDAHNLLVHATAELGWLGGLATVALFVLPMAGAARAARKRTRNGKVTTTVEPLRRSPVNHAVYAAAAVMVVAGIWLGFSGHWPYEPTVLLVLIVSFAAAPFVGIALCALAASDTLAPVADAPAPMLRLGIWAAVAGFLVHGQISLAPSVPAVRTVAIVLMAAAIALDRIDERPAASPRQALPAWCGWIAVFGACTLLVLQVVLLVRPVTDANQFIERAVGDYRRARVRAARERKTMSDSITRQALERAVEADPLDAAPHLLMAELNRSRARRMPKGISAGLYFDAADDAWRQVRQRRDSAALSGAHADALREYLAWETPLRTPDDRLLLRARLVRRILRLSREAVARYPAGREHHIRLAEVLAAEGVRAEALQHFRRAIELDDALADYHATRKLPGERRKAIEQRIQRLSTRPAALLP